MAERKIDIKIDNNDGNVYITVAGRIDAITSRELEKRVHEVVLAGFKSMRFNLKDVDYISSSGLRVLLYAKKKLEEVDSKAELVVEDPQPQVLEIFNITGFSSEVLSVEYMDK